jgi:hypothetical protein
MSWSSWRLFQWLFKKKGENLATKEDIKDLTAQTALLTQTAKEIEATISDKMWDRQKRWELKRDQIILVAQKATTIHNILVSLQSAFLHHDANMPVSLPDRMKTADLALDALEGAGLMASLVCTSELYMGVFSFVSLARTIILDMLRGNPRAWDNQLGAYTTEYNSMLAVMRKELTSTEGSSEAPGNTTNVTS